MREPLARISVLAASETSARVAIPISVFLSLSERTFRFVFA
jgi:hypothetical protein